MISVLLKATRAEFAKFKRTLAFWMVLLAPLLILILQIGMFFKYGDFYLAQVSDEPWQTFGQNMLTYWSLLMLPLFITLETALLAALEHNQKNLKTLYVQPLPRWSIYLAKLIANFSLIGLSMLVIILFMFIGGKFFGYFFPNFNFNQPFPLGWELKAVAEIFIASCFMIAFHTWVSMRWPSFVIASACGIACTVAGLFVFGSDQSYFFPWTIPGLLATHNPFDPKYLYSMWVALGAGIVAIGAGTWSIIRRDVI